MDIQAGNLVYSIAGRDNGNVFLVLSVDLGFCYLADGKIRKVSNPQKKKIKHVKSAGKVAETLKEKIALGVNPTNAEVRNCIRDLMEDVKM